jgi:hypothetical protein
MNDNPKIMKICRKPSSLGVSLGAHGIFIALIALFLHHAEIYPLLPKKIEVDVIVKKASPVFHPVTLSAPHRHQHPAPSIANLDLRPIYLKEGLFSAPKISTSNPSHTQEMLATPFRVLTAFDHLASQVDRNLEFPDLFVENGVQGRAILDLRFDSEGKVDENASRFSGSHHAIRGLPIKLRDAA